MPGRTGPARARCVNSSHRSIGNVENRRHLRLKSTTDYHPSKPALFQIDDPHDHTSPRIERQLFEPEAPVEIAHRVVERVGQHPEAPDLLRQSDGRGQREEQERAGIALTLMAAIHCELAEQNDRDRVGAISLFRFREVFPRNLGSAERDIADNAAVLRLADDAGARHAAFLIAPGMATEPLIERLPPAVETRAVVVGGQWPGWLQSCHAGRMAASSRSATFVFAGAFTQASNCSQYTAGIVTWR